MNESDENRRFDESQFALILKKAAEMQERDPAGRAGAGLTIREMEGIAAEAGIQPEYIRQAVASIARRSPTAWSRVTGQPYDFRAQRSLRVQPGDDQLSLMLDVLREETGRTGVARHVLGAVEWSAKDDFGWVHVSVRPQSDATRVRVTAQRRDTAIVLGILLPLAGTFAGMAAGAATGPGVALGLGLAGAAGGFAAARLAWQAVASRWRDRVERLADRISETVTAAVNAAKQPQDV